MTSAYAHRSHLVASALAVTLLVAGGHLAAASAAHAEDGPSKPPGSEVTAEPPKIDVNAPGLRLGDGATLAEPRVLDIKFVTETFGIPETQAPTETTAPVETETDAPVETEDPGTEIDDIEVGERQEVTNSNTKFTLQSDLLFSKGSAELNSSANARLKEIAEEISKQSPEKVNIFGFTDNLGSYESGITLSKQRASAVHHELIKNIESTEITFNIRGYSEDYPIADNSTEEGRQKNRRVEISFPLMKS